jgi:hypothetical protein
VIEIGRTDDDRPLPRNRKNRTMITRMEEAETVFERYSFRREYEVASTQGA